MKSSEYWQRRFDELEAALLRKGERYNASEVERQFKMAMAAIEKEISYWYQRLGSNNGVSAAEARRLLSADELREFHWTVEEYIKYGRTAGFTDKWMKQLENASAKAHISRLDAIKLQIQQQIEVLYGNQVDGLDRLMRDIYTEGYNRSAYTIDKGMGVHYNLASTDSGRIDTIINQPWAGDGKIFSDRLWRDKDKLVNTLQQEMTQAVTRGDKLGDAVKKIASRMNVAKSSAARLVMTESAFISGRSQRDCFKGLGVNKYEYVATLDRKTSEICQEMDGKVFDIDDYKPGTNAPPMHCWCRSCIAPYFDDEEISERAARDPKTGKTVRVPGEMKYDSWYNKYVEPTTRPTGKGNWEIGSDGNIVVTEVVSSSYGKAPARGIPNAVVQHNRKNGQHDFDLYDGNGFMTLQVHCGNHGNPKHHEYGICGEHAADWIWILENGKWTGHPGIDRELTDEERRWFDAEIKRAVKHSRAKK
ncbi:minor capsid protein [Schwartzia succinivorans]|uniref:Phage putative head morphogenesis protein, SPP1 gp7 family n=1 Tax=Schwartzia succinivorans DSM 10502 TaxID=1123243 RepID=A0A1M4V4W7_9FIRM|nr:minor capsid protein [Schwartzia succinivorans]SHE63923.1 phage putative head morphogenesis protein, SPP1 gp7 family [Schwartzia succinivorans DSM 10502]